MRGLRNAALLLLVAAASAPGQAAVTVQSATLALEFSDHGDLLHARACLPACDAPRPRTFRFSGGTVSGRLLSFTGPASESFVLERSQGADAVELSFEDPGSDSYRRWRIPKNGWRLELAAAGATGLDVEGGPNMGAVEASGFGVWLERPRYVLIGRSAVRVQDLDEAVEAGTTDGWTGFRNRFWTVMGRPQTALPYTLRSGDAVNEPALHIDSGGAPLALSLYVGPVEPEALESAAPALTGMMYASLWFWLRWICQFLFWLLGLIHVLVPHWASAVMLLSVAVSVLMRPLSRLADRLQDQVHRTEAVLAPRLSEIKAAHRGEEQSRRVLELYREHGVHPLYSLKSLAAVAVVIPVFIGAFDMLAENIWLAGAPFLWIEDLSRPDAFAPLPFELPFFGDRFNLLPFLMTALSVWAAMLHRHADLDTAQLRRHRRNLILMAIAFLALFYTFPAGMVLYWATNNFISVVRYGWRNRRRAPVAKRDHA